MAIEFGSNSFHALLTRLLDLQLQLGLLQCEHVSFSFEVGQQLLSCQHSVVNVLLPHFLSRPVHLHQQFIFIPFQLSKNLIQSNRISKNRNRRNFPIFLFEIRQHWKYLQKNHSTEITRKSYKMRKKFYFENNIFLFRKN